MIRIATVGTSSITEKFLSATIHTGRYKLSAVYSRSSETGRRFADKYFCKKVYTNLEEMASDKKIDAVYIATPNIFHYEQSKLFLESGKHVICEKPIVSSLSQYTELKKYADRHNLVYMEAIMSVHSNAREKLMTALDNIGLISQARIDFSKRSSRYDSYKSGKKVNIFDMSLHEGTLMDIGIYCVYACVDMFGMPNEIIAKASYLDNGADSAGVSIFCYDNFNAVLTYSKIGQSAIDSEIIGDKGVIKITSVSQYTGISSVADNKESLIFGSPQHAEVMCGEAEKFADIIEKPQEYKEYYDKISELTCNVHKCMDMIKKSADIHYN